MQCFKVLFNKDTIVTGKTVLSFAPLKLQGRKTGGGGVGEGGNTPGSIFFSSAVTSQTESPKPVPGNSCLFSRVIQILVKLNVG